MTRVPCGYRFHPTDQELLVTYLKRKIHSLPLPCDIIKEVELYKHDPSDLIGQFTSEGEEKCYFFTPTYRRYVNGSRPNRTTKNGYWKASTADMQIKDERSNVIGTKRSLVFYYGEHPHGKKSDWIMHEYKLTEYQNTTHVQIPSDPMKLDEWVLCSIYENLSTDKREKRKRKAIEELDRRIEKKAIVVQQEDNDQHLVSSYDILDNEPTHDASYMGWASSPTSDSDVADFVVPIQMMAAKETGIENEERAAMVQGQYMMLQMNEYKVNDQSVVSDNLENRLIHDAADVRWDIPLMSDADLADFAELVGMIDRGEL